MDITTMLNSKGPVTTSEIHIQHLSKSSQMNVHNISENNSEMGNNSDHSSGYSSKSAKALQAMPNMPNMRYQSPSHLQHPMPMLANGYSNPALSQENSNVRYFPANYDEQNNVASRAPGNEGNKAFACQTCSKGFARRSDLARHERIHSGVRPHMCDHPGCKKQFIQRSALTVHARVHTGEKPHMCERCSKPFSDSSSLARHRRIHSGKRPYKCPYASCQKTFTRRTTLTRHQNHHTGTVEEAAASTAAILASASRPSAHSYRTDSDGGTYSETSAQSTPSMGPRNLSMSPSNEIPHMPGLNRSSSDYFTSGGLPPHMRSDLMPQQPSPRSSPSAPSPTLSSFGSNQHRPSLTSHPSMYGPPPILEPPTHHEQRQPVSAGGSPHLSSVGWHSPSHPGSMGSPSHHGEPSYMYPEPPYSAPVPHLYYPNSNIRRPQSTEPEHYDSKTRLVTGELWNGHM